MSFVQNDNNNDDNNSRNERNNSNNSVEAQEQPKKTDKEGMHDSNIDEQEEQQSQQQEEQQQQSIMCPVPSKDSVTSELTATTIVHPSQPQQDGLSGSAVVSVSVDAGIAVVVLGIETSRSVEGDDSVGSDVDTTTTTTTMSVATATAVDKVHAVSDGASASSSRSISSVSSSDMTAVVVDTARPKGGRGVIVLAQPLCRSFQGLHIKDGRPREKEQERGQDTATHERPTRSASLRQNPCDESSSTSSASASMVATEGSLDKFLLTALQNRQDRLFLLKLEREYCNFIEDPSEDVLEFPWLNSYYRMMIHRSAIYFQLARKVDANQKKITLSKSEHSAIPVLRFHELVEEEGEEDVPVKSFKVLRRCPPRPVSACEAREGTMSTTALVASAPTSSSTSSKHTVTPLSSSSSSSSIPLSDRRSVSFEQREKAYAEARARIFHKEGEEAAEEEEEDEDARTGITGDSGIKEKPRPISSSKATTPAGIAITIESQPPPKPEHGLSHAQGQGQGQAKARQYDLIRRTSTSSTISSSSSSSGTAMTEISSRSDFVGSWMAGNDGSSRSGYQGSSSGMIDHRTGRNNGAYCECGADHGLYGVAAAVGPGSEMSSGPQYNNNNINNSRRPCQHQEPSYHPSCPCQNHGSQGSSRHHVHGSHGSHGHHVGYPSSNRQRSSYPACHHHHQPFQHQHHFQHQHQHQVQHSHQHHPGYQHTVVTPSHGHPMICPPQQQQHRHPYYNQHQQHQYQQLHNQHYQPRQYQHQIHNHHYHAAPHPSYAHQQHHQHLQQHSHDQHQYNRGFQDPRCCEYVRSEMIPPGQGSMRPTDQIQEIQYSSSSTSSSSTEAATNHSSGLFQVSVRPYPSSNGYRPYRQGISLPQQLNRQGQQHRQQQQHHRHPQSQGQRQQQHRQQGSSNARQQQYRGNQQQHQQKQQLSVGSIDHHPQTHHSLNPSSTTIPTHTLSQGSKPREEKEEGESCNNSTKQAHSQSQQQQHQHMNTPARGGAMKGREESAMESTPRVYDVERRPPKSTELYDPYATPACGSGTKSRKH